MCASSETIDLRTLEFGQASTPQCPSTASKRATNLHILISPITRGTLARSHELKMYWPDQLNPDFEVRRGALSKQRFFLRAAEIFSGSVPAEGQSHGRHSASAASSSGASFFAWQRRARNASDWWWTARDHGKRFGLPLLAHRRETSGYEAGASARH